MMLAAVIGALFVVPITFADSNFEDSRCRCVCPNTRYFVGENQTAQDDNHRRFYTMSNVGPAMCNPIQVVKKEVALVIDDSHVDGFLANCECRYESRNTVMLKVVVIFVMCLLALLVVYMAFLMFLDPVLRKQRFGAGTTAFNYQQQNDEIETNIFSGAAQDSASTDDVVSSSSSVRPRAQSNVLGRVEAEQSRWMKKVEAQRKNIFTDHTMLN